MTTFLSDSEGSDDQGERTRTNADSAAVPRGATLLLSDDEDAPAPPQAVESPARVRRGGLRRSAPAQPPQPVIVQERSTRTAASSSSSPIARAQGPALQPSEKDSLRERKLAERMESLSSEMQALRQENEHLSQKNAKIQEQVKATEQSWSQREVKLKAMWNDDRIHQDSLTRERCFMECEDERTALQREVVQQVHRARNILSNQGSQLVRKSEELASENVKLEEQAHSQAVKHEKQQKLVAELQEAVAHAEDRQAQFEEQAAISSRRYQEAEAEAEFRHARDELAQASGDKGVPRQDRLCQDSAAILGVLLKQLHGIPQYQLPGEGKTHCMGVKRKAIRALDKQAQRLERANFEWASHLVEQGLVSQEQALSLCKGAKREDAQSSFDSAGLRESSQQVAERLRERLQCLQVLCRS